MKAMAITHSQIKPALDKFSLKIFEDLHLLFETHETSIVVKVGRVAHTAETLGKLWDRSARGPALRCPRTPRQHQVIGWFHVTTSLHGIMYNVSYTLPIKRNCPRQSR